MSNIVYDDYWKRKDLRRGMPAFSVVSGWETDGLCDSDHVMLDAIRPAKSLLDVGAGDLRVMKKFRAAGYAGEYHTQDIGGEYAHTYTDLAAVDRTYDAILCLDVIEHLPLAEGLTMLDRLCSLLAAGGVLVVQTPNAKCMRDPMSWDMTHLHVFNLGDLWAFVAARGLTAAGHRVWFTDEKPHWKERVVARVRKYLVTRFLLMDYAENIILVARKA